MPACGTRSFSSAAVIRLWARVRPSHNLVVSSAPVLAGAEACDLDLDGAAHPGQIIVGAFELALPTIEVTVHGGDGKMLGREADVGVSGIEFVLDHLVLLESGLLLRTTCVRNQL